MRLPRFVAPAGTVLRGSDLLGWLRGAGTGHAALDGLEAAFRARYGRRHVFFLSSGRAGMTILLRALAERAPGRSEVAVPGYTCYSVAASAVRAGLTVRPLDVAPAAMDIAPEARDSLDPARTLALVATSLYGLPAALPAHETWARQHDVALVDDAAQCLDGQVGGRWSGTFGDAGLFSFDKGKNITALQGGVVTCDDDELADRLARLFRAMPAPGAGTVAAQSLQLLAYTVLLRPWLYWLPNRLLRLGETPFELEYPTTRFAPSLAALVGRQFARIDAITGSRVAHAARLRAGLAGAPGLLIPGDPSARNVHPRFAIVFADGVRRDATLARLVDGGIGATGSYPLALRDVPGLAPYLAADTADTPRARAVARGLLTLPTHGHVTDRDLAAMVTLITRP